MAFLEFDLECDLDRFRLIAAGAIEGGITGLFGPSGSGKTTLLHALAGLRRVDRGTITVGGRTLFDSARGIDLPAEERRVGVVFQDGRLFPHLDVTANLRFGVPGRRAANDGPALEEVVKLLDLESLLRRYPTGLSGGERQRVALGRALLAAPRVLLLDEPLASLDRARRETVLPYLRRLPERFGIPLLYVTHDLAELLTLTDRMVLLEGGSVRAHGSYRDIAMADAWNSLGMTGIGGRVNVLPGEVIAVEGSLCRVLLGMSSRAESAAPTSDVKSDRVLLVAVGHNVAVGDRVLATIGAEEIALAVGEIGETSIQNRFQTTIERRFDHDGATVIELRISSSARLLVEVTTASAERLALGEGKSVVGLVKASAITLSKI